MALTFADVLPDVMEEWRAKSKSKLHADDIEAWAYDVLGERYWSKQSEIIHSFQANRRTAVKSANGTGKSRMVGGVIAHWVTTGEMPGDNLALVTGPSLKTVRDVVWKYLNQFYGIAMANDANWPGTIYSSLQDLAWRQSTTGKKEPALMALGLKPGDGTDIIGAFQGRRGTLKTAVFADEAGSLHPDIYDAAEAVTTGPDELMRLFFIGNPDNGRGSHFYRIFNEEGLAKHWERFTISAYELPTFTGEVVYPDDPKKQRLLLNGGMPTPDWVEDKKGLWGEGSARWLSKVLGEFPGEDDHSMFSQTAIDRAYGTEIDPYEKPLKMGVDLAFGGMDETQVYFNRGGQIRKHEGWSKATPLENTRKIHAIAMEYGATEVRVDASGAGEGVYDNLTNLEEFSDRNYEVIGIIGGNASPDPTQWAQARSWHYDQFRQMMLAEEIDLDNDDGGLRDELISQTYDFNLRGAIQVTPKREMRRLGLPSPDSLDAAIYSAIEPFFEDIPRAQTHTIDTETVIGEIQTDDFLSAYHAYRW